MSTKRGQELLAAANPVPNVDQLEGEAFSIDNVLDRLDDALVPATSARTTRYRWGRSLAVAAAAFVLVIAIGAAGALVLRGDRSTASDTEFSCGDSETVTTARGDFYGSVRYNPFIGIQSSLLSPSDEPIFSAGVTGGMSAEDMYFRLITVESYDGNQFFASRPAVDPPTDRPWVDPCHAWNGPTIPVTVDVEIDRLRMGWLPAPATPTAWHSAEELPTTIQVRHEDGALALDGELTYQGMQYSVDAEIPRLDMSALVADRDGVLTTAFAAAAENGESVPSPQPSQTLRAGPRDPGRHTGLPAGDAFGTEELRTLAREITAGAESSFERGLYLEAWFHSEAFSYSVDTEPGLEASGITTWLLDVESPSYHHGYAEHFTTAMAVLARTLEIPSRLVLGFAPGEPMDEEAVVFRDRNAHAWVELWIPQVGWVAFDPTPRSADDTTQTFESVSEQLGFDLLAYLRP